MTGARDVLDLSDMTADELMTEAAIASVGRRPGYKLATALAAELRRERDRAESAEAERDAARALLRETLRPGAYGVGSTLAQRIDAELAAGSPADRSVSALTETLHTEQRRTERYMEERDRALETLASLRDAVDNAAKSLGKQSTDTALSAETHRMCCADTSVYLFKALAAGEAE